MKYCEVGKHKVNALWRAKRTNRETGEITPSCCKDCLPKAALKKNKAKKESPELKTFFADAALVFPERCENCGERLDNSTSFARKAQTAHILPKSIFKSVSAHPSNKMFLCCFHGDHCHGNWDNLDADKRKTMPVYQKALERFKSLKKHLNSKDMIRAEIYLGLSKK